MKSTSIRRGALATTLGVAVGASLLAPSGQALAHRTTPAQMALVRSDMSSTVAPLRNAAPPHLSASRPHILPPALPAHLVAASHGAPNGSGMPDGCSLAAIHARRAPGHAFSLPVACLSAVLAAPNTARTSVLNRAASAGKAPAVLPTGVITTYAGGMNSPGSAPTNYGLRPYATAFDGPGHLLISDRAHNVVWLANLSGTVVNLFGQSIPAGHMAVIAGADDMGSGGDGGPATAASFNSPSGIAVDSAGNLYVADTYNYRIREVLASTGIITTVAGNGTACCSLGDGGPATQAELDYPQGVALDTAGNLFIADTDNSRIREVLSGTGIITTVAGSSTGGYGGDGGPATQAALNFPEDVAVDGSGNLFIADQYNNRIREVLDSTGIITTVAGNGSPQCKYPRFICFGGDGGPATSAELHRPYGVVVDGVGNLFITDTHNQRIREVFAATGVITTVAGNGEQGYSGDGGPATQAQLYDPHSVTVDGAGNLFIADSGTRHIREVLASTGIITSMAGDGALAYGGDRARSIAAEMSLPNGVAADGMGNVYISDTRNNRIREVIAATGVITTVVGDGDGCAQQVDLIGDGCPATQAELNNPSGVAIDSKGNVFIADYFNQRIREVLDSTGIITTVAGTGSAGYSGDGGPATRADLQYPTGVAVDGAGNLFIADFYNNRIREVIAATGVITTVAGNGKSDFTCANGPATSAGLTQPQGVAVDGAGNIYIADGGSSCIREVIAATGIMIRVAGLGGQSGFSGDGGPATRARLYLPTGVSVDRAGNLFIADQYNNRIREVLDSTGIITTVAGNGTNGFGGDGGPGTSAALAKPYSVAVDGAGNLLIADTNNNRIRTVRLH